MIVRPTLFSELKSIQFIFRTSFRVVGKESFHFLSFFSTIDYTEKVENLCIFEGVFHPFNVKILRHVCSIVKLYVFLKNLFFFL